MMRRKNWVAPRPQGPAALGGWGKGLLAITALSAAVLAGCGGGGGGDIPATTDLQTSSVGVRVIDGAIHNALVCLDINGNGACDSSEPSARTDADGNATLQVAPADVGKYPVLAVVGTDAVDEDTGAVPVPFVMKAPADQPAIVSPLTTLVQTTVETSGVSSTQAAANVQSQLGLSVSLFEDFTENDTAEGQTLGTIARMVVVTQQQQSTALTSTVGSTAIDGSTITQLDLDKLIARKLAEILPALVAAVGDPAVQTAIASGDVTAIDAALKPLASSIVADANTGISTGSVATLVGVANQATSGNEAPSTAGQLQLHTLNFTDAQNWFRRLITTSAAEAVPDADNLVRFRDNRLRSKSGVQAAWSFGSDPDRQGDVHWNGSAWVQCGLLQESKASQRDAQGRNGSNYCDNFDVSNSLRATFDIAGRTMADVYDQIRSAGYTNITIANAATALGSTVFPAGSKVLYQTNTPTSTAPTYLSKTGQVIRIYNSDALAVGDATACNAVTASTPIGSYTAEATSLEAMIARLPGAACAYPQQTITGAGGASLSSGARNEAWGFASLSIGQIGNAPLASSPGTATTFWSTNQLLRVAFGPGNAAKFYSCQQRSWDGSARNCDLIGTGTYAIATLGDARTLTFQNTPPQFGTVTYERVFVERGGKVYYGYKNKPTPASQARFNMEAGNALLAQLGLATATPEDTLAVTPASFQGDWIFWASAGGADGYLGSATVIRIPQNFNGSTGAQCFDAVSGTPGSGFTCNVTIDAAGALSFTDTRDGALASATLDMVAGTASGTSTDTSGTAAILGRRR